jgi:ankyrin repeat protein
LENKSTYIEPAGGDTEAVKAFLDRGMNPNVEEEETGRTALMRVAARGHVDVVNALLASRPRLRIPDHFMQEISNEDGKTALMHVGAVRALLASRPRLHLEKRRGT